MLETRRPDVLGGWNNQAGGAQSLMVISPADPGILQGLACAPPAGSTARRRPPRRLLRGGKCSPSAGLADTSWTVASMAEPATLADSSAVTFAQDGTVSGNSGCNQYSGPYRVDGDKISVRPVRATLMGCEE